MLDTTTQMHITGMSTSGACDTSGAPPSAVTRRGTFADHGSDVLNTTRHTGGVGGNTPMRSGAEADPAITQAIKHVHEPRMLRALRAAGFRAGHATMCPFGVAGAPMRGNA